MIRFLLRLLATLALAVAVVMAVLDATRSIAISTPTLTPLIESWQSASPDTLAALRAFVEGRLGEAAWDPALVSVLSLPGFAVFAGLALVLYMLGHRPERHRSLARR